MIGRADVYRLLPDRLGPCISLYMTTRPGGPASHEDRVRFQNLLSALENDLVLRGYTPASAEELLASAEALGNEAEFWRTESDGLAMFIAPDFFIAGRLSSAARTFYRIASRFHIRPLLPLVDATHRFYILALDQDSARFFEATPRSVAEIPLGSGSATETSTIEEARRLHRNSESDNFAVATGPRGLITARPADSPSLDREELNLLQFLRTVERQINTHLRGERVPLLLACVGYLAQLYEGVNSYGRLLPVKVPGNPLKWTTRELHEHAYRIIEPYLQRDRLDFLGRFHEAKSANRASSDGPTIVTAAEQGLVDVLFLVDGDERTCDFQTDGQSDFIHETGQDICERVAARTLRHGGRLCILDRSEMPDGQPLAAIFHESQSPYPTQSQSEKNDEHEQ